MKALILMAMICACVQSDAKSWVTKRWDDTKSGAQKFGKGVVDTGKDFGEGVVDAGKKIGKGAETAATETAEITKKGWHETKKGTEKGWHETKKGWEGTKKGTEREWYKFREGVEKSRRASKQYWKDEKQYQKESWKKRDKPAWKSGHIEKVRSPFWHSIEHATAKDPKGRTIVYSIDKQLTHDMTAFGFAGKIASSCVMHPKACKKAAKGDPAELSGSVARASAVGVIGAVAKGIAVGSVRSAKGDYVSEKVAKHREAETGKHFSLEQQADVVVKKACKKTGSETCTVLKTVTTVAGLKDTDSGQTEKMEESVKEEKDPENGLKLHLKFRSLHLPKEKTLDAHKTRIGGNKRALEKIGSVMRVIPYPRTGGAVTNDAEFEELVTHLEVADSLEVKKGATVHMGGNPVHGVGYGQLDDDAVNMRQLRDTAASLRREIGHVDKNASRGIASAMASAGLNQASLPGKYMISAGAADYRGQAALALGISTLSEDGRWSLKGTVNANEKNTGVTVSVGYQW